MKTKKTIVYGLIAVILALTFTACSKSGGGSGSGGGGKSLNSAAELKEYLDKQPANSPDKPIKVAMKANDAMLKNIATVINEAGKYVSLDLSGSPLTEIPREAFYDTWDGGYKTLVGITIPNGVTRISSDAFKDTGLTSVIIPNSVTEIEWSAFKYCESLTSVNIPNSVTEIRSEAFRDTGLTSVTFQGTIAKANLGGGYGGVFYGDLEEKYLAGGIGTYTTSNPGRDAVWTKQ